MRQLSDLPKTQHKQGPKHPTALNHCGKRDGFDLDDGTNVEICTTTGPELTFFFLPVDISEKPYSVSHEIL